MNLNLQLDQVAEHIRDLIWDQLATELQLVSCQQGCPEQLRTLDDLAQEVPAVLLDPPRWAGARPDDSLPAVEGTVTIHLSYLRRIQAGEEHPRATVTRLSRLASLFLTPDFSLSGWDNSTGFAVERIWPSDVQHEHDLTYEDAAVRIALGTVTLQATCIAYLPAG